LKIADLGKTGLRVSRLCFGTGTRGYAGQSRQTKLGLEELVRLLRLAYELGVTFWDAADGYGSHPHVREALRGLARETVVVATKTSTRGAPDAERAVERFLRELGTSYVDVVLLHCMTHRGWPASYDGAMGALARLKERGLVRAVGVSCHDLGALEAAASHPWVDVVLARINAAGVHTDAAPAKVVPVLERIHAAGKGLYGMKALGEGRLAGDVRSALAYALGLLCLDSIAVGIESERELREDVRLVEELDRVQG